MEFIDTHTHLFAEEFDADRAAVIQRAIQNRVNTMLLPNIDAASIQALNDCAALAPANCLPMMGLHPCSVGPNVKEELEVIRKELFEGGYYRGVGEIGLDLYWDKTTADAQKTAFIMQCEWAVELGLGVSMHTRNATYETIACLKSLKKAPQGVFHCFTGSFEEATEILKLGFKLGIGGVVTYKNAHLPEVLKRIPLEHLVLETDAPYLPPVPYRGKRNESAYIPLIAEKLSDVYGVGVQTIADATSASARSVFGL